MDSLFKWTAQCFPYLLLWLFLASCLTLAPYPANIYGWIGAGAIWSWIIVLGMVRILRDIMCYRSSNKDTDNA